ncbi:transmembrane protein, putative (macronuclear) [Tetrahymena thermophila SB210]|uniref:Transmembrane protein, putative n=1 Tax=Tetrahymena thermophila (strain SB210) TaxID=312017 RepID=A4VE56_TETTS|nr:transmembrane protein, putative [Tetrahymena thermophila SB210]EDK31812.1 transmembrane protein, putative [Tetrahymena thermophila SB210]|eukprot:XP_001471297.1 transmembrane protein, putative [Tetrahymena thermophila SB210]
MVNTILKYKKIIDTQINSQLVRYLSKVNFLFQGWTFYLQSTNKSPKTFINYFFMINQICRVNQIKRFFIQNISSFYQQLTIFIFQQRKPNQSVDKQILGQIKQSTTDLIYKSLQLKLIKEYFIVRGFQFEQQNINYLQIKISRYTLKISNILSLFVQLNLLKIIFSYNSIQNKNLHFK